MGVRMTIRRGGFGRELDVQRVTRHPDGCDFVRGGRPRWEAESHVCEPCAVRIGQLVAGLMHKRYDREALTFEWFGVV